MYETAHASHRWVVWSAFLNGLGRSSQTVVSPNQGSPAEKAGIQPGDALLSIGGKSTATMGLYDAASELQGPEGRSVDSSSTPRASQRTNSTRISGKSQRFLWVPQRLAGQGTLVLSGSRP